MKRLKEEVELRVLVVGKCDSITGEYYSPISHRTKISKSISALIRAVDKASRADEREACVKKKKKEVEAHVKP